MAYSKEIISAAKYLYLRKYKPAEITKELRLGSSRVIYNWIEKYNWEALVIHESAEESFVRRINLLSERENKTEAELNELILISKQLLAMRELDHKIKLAETSHNQGDTDRSPKAGNRKGSRKARKKKNDISMLTAEDFEREFHSKLYWHQKKLMENKHHKIRNCLKSRQLGYTWYFAGEAFEEAVLTGTQQIFLSATRNQSEVFLAYIRAMALDWFGIELSGTPCKLSNGAIMRPVATATASAQSYSGNFYMDEYFWIPKFDEIEGVASGMATHDEYRMTYFSTPSSRQHQAYKFWQGSTYKKENPKKSRKWPSDKDILEGALCPDGHWRFSCTMEKAVSMGFDKVNIEQLKNSKSKAVFANLYNCEFVDNTHSVIGQELIEKALTDPSKWKDFNPNENQPFGNQPVWLGFDPSRRKDNSTIAIIAPPSVTHKKFRVLQHYSWRNESFEFQADQIKRLTKQYNVQYIGIDITGIGEGVFDNVASFYPQATAIRYSVETKKAMVEKAKDVFSSKRIEWDATQQDIGPAFLSIKQEVTRGGIITYASDRTAEAGHADVAWSIMHTLINEPNNYSNQRSSTWDLS